ncbi:MAG: MCE family protein [Alphaproteobacteria bacterium]|nr:MCE family protein [Alphaproteobacteria bacterium]
METRAHYAAVGAFVVTMVAIAFAAVLWLARGELSTQNAFYDIFFDGPVSGLRQGAPVEYNGVPVGRVREVMIDPNNVEKIRVTVEIDNKVAIKTDAAAAVETNILSGVSFIQVVGGTQDAALLMPKEGQRYPVIRAHRSRLASVTARLPQVVEKLSEVADRVNAILDEKNQKALADSLQHIESFSASLADRSQELRDLTSSANKAAGALTTLLDDVDKSYVGPEGLGNRATTAFNDIDKTARSLGDASKQAQQALQDVRPGLHNFSTQTLGDIGSLVGDARQLLGNLNRFTTQIERDPSQILFGDRREGYRPK